ncbi:CARDB domain-containing protein [Streptomyces sp. NPDC056069]|uniref:CARDB domain-containing protein n=1 Tax=Streptomyces sp. NPDC056069 TaxID=3345702 RepID=UPI0035D8BAF1
MVDPLDVAVSLRADPTAVAPGGFFDLMVGAKVVSGTAGKVDVTVALPVGVTYVEKDSAIRCEPGADGRSFTCHLSMSHGSVDMPVTLKVDKGAAADSTLGFTATGTPVDATDSKPENNTATATVRTTAGADLAVAWKTSATSVRPGEKFTAELVVTNNGPATAKGVAVAVYNGYDHFPKGYDKRCWWDPGTAVCEQYADLAPGGSLTFPFTWEFDKAAAGTTFTVEASLYSNAALDLVKENNKGEFAVKILKDGKPKPTATPTTRPTPSPSTSTAAAPQPSHSPQSGTGTGGSLANTGSGPLPALAGGAALLTAAGALLARSRTRTRREH